MTDTLGLILFVVVCAASIADSDGAEYIRNVSSSLRQLGSEFKEDRLARIGHA